MDLFASRKLFDIVTRQSVYIEQVKVDETNRFAAVLKEIEEEFKKLLPRIKYDTLDGLTKSQLQIFLKDLKVSQTRVYSRYQKALIERLQAFMAATTVQTMRVSASFNAHTFAPEGEEQEDIKLVGLEQAKVIIEAAMKKNDNSALLGFAVLGGTSAAMGLLWSKIRNAPLPSGGAYPVDYINAAIASAMVNVENAVRNAWAAKKTIAELKADVLGGTTTQRKADGSSVEVTATGVLTKANNAMRAVLATTMQHVAQQSKNSVNSAIWPEYVWVSILDSRTSEICIRLNGQHWRYGEGPLPPAHPHCRSDTMPFDYWNSGFELPPFEQWLKAQPYAFLEDVFGATIARKIKDGTLSAAELAALKVFKPKSIAEFLKRTSDLL